MANIVRATNSSITRIAKNQLGAAAVASFTAYMTGCILISSDKEYSKKELLTELYSAAYVTWKWYMGLGPEPPVNTGIPDEVSRCKELTEGR